MTSPTPDPPTSEASASPPKHPRPLRDALAAADAIGSRIGGRLPKAEIIGVRLIRFPALGHPEPQAAILVTGSHVVHIAASAERLQYLIDSVYEWGRDPEKRLSRQAIGAKAAKGIRMIPLAEIRRLRWSDVHQDCWLDRSQAFPAEDLLIQRSHLSLSPSSLLRIGAMDGQGFDEVTPAIIAAVSHVRGQEPDARAKKRPFWQRAPKKSVTVVGALGFVTVMALFAGLFIGERELLVVAGFFSLVTLVMLFIVWTNEQNFRVDNGDIPLTPYDYDIRWPELAAGAPSDASPADGTAS